MQKNNFLQTNNKTKTTFKVVYLVVKLLFLSVCPFVCDHWPFGTVTEYCDKICPCFSLAPHHWLWTGSDKMFLYVMAVWTTNEARAINSVNGLFLCGPQGHFFTAKHRDTMTALLYLAKCFYFLLLQDSLGRAPQ